VLFTAHLNLHNSTLSFDPLSPAFPPHFPTPFPCFPTYLDDVLVGEGLVGLIVLGVLEQDAIHVGAGVLVQLVAGREDDQGDLAVAEHGQLVGLLHHAELALVEGHLGGAKKEYRKRKRKCVQLGTHAQIFMRFENVIRGMALAQVAWPSGKVAGPSPC